MNETVTRLLSRSLRILILVALSALAAIAAVLLLRLQERSRGVMTTGDYSTDADASLVLAAHGHVFAMFGTNPLPLMLPFALIPRIPFVWFESLTQWAQALYPQAKGADLEMYGRYAAGVVGLAGCGAFAVMAVHARENAKQWVAAALLALVIVLNPLAMSTYSWAHPEEAFGAALLVATVIAGERNRWALAGALLGAACAVKQPFLFATPTFLLMAPTGQRRRFAASCAGAFALLVLPLVAPHAGSILRTNTGVAHSTGAESGYVNNFWTVFGLKHAGVLGKPLAALLALVLPAAIASRRGWRLTLRAGTAVLAIVLIWRCVLDPYNIGYYLAPAAAVVIALEWIVWQEGVHPLGRVGALQRWIIPVPALGLAASFLLTGFAGGWLDRAIADTYGFVNGKVFMLGMLTATAVLAAIAVDAKIKLTRSRAMLYGALPVAAVVLLGGSQLVGGGARKESLLVKPPAGYVAVKPVVMAQKTAPEHAYYLGSRVNTVNPLVLSSVQIKMIKDRNAQTLTAYGSGGSNGMVYVFTRLNTRHLPDDRVAELKKCQAGDCPAGHELATSSIGPGLLKRNVNTWELTIPTARGSVFVFCELPLDPLKVAQQLVPVPAAG